MSLRQKCSGSMETSLSHLMSKGTVHMPYIYWINTALILTLGHNYLLLVFCYNGSDMVNLRGS